jgi:hypothetical protein
MVALIIFCLHAFDAAPSLQMHFLWSRKSHEAKYEDTPTLLMAVMYDSFLKVACVEDSALLYDTFCRAVE